MIIPTKDFLMSIIFFDIDGTLTTTKSGATFKQNAEDIKLLKGVEAGVEYFHQRGFALVGISNQGGCTAINEEMRKPFKTTEEVVEEFRNTLKLVPELECIYFCPDFKGYYCYKVGKNDSEVIKYDNPQETELVPYANYD